DNTEAIRIFEHALKLQSANITERGEGEATNTLRNQFEKLKKGDTTQHSFRVIEQQLQLILSSNMQAIEKKSRLAEKTAEDALTIITLLGGLVLLISFTF